MKLLITAVFLMLLAMVNGHRTRSLLQGNSGNNGKGPGNDNGNHNGWGNGNGNKHGKFFNFTDSPGGARGFLKDLEANNPGKLGRVIGNSRWSRTADELATQLEQDPDFVSVQHAARSVAHTALIPFALSA